MKKISLWVVTLFAVFAFVAISSSVVNAQDVACPAGYTCTPIVVQSPICPAGYICTPTNVQNLDTNTDCGFSINNISPKSRVNFPLKVEGTIDNSSGRSCYWGTFEGRVGTAQLYYNYNNTGWKTIGQSSIVKTTTDNQIKISFATSLNFNNEGIGLPPGTLMKIVFNDENVSGLMNSSHTFELPIVLAGNIASSPSPTPTSFPPLPIVPVPCLSLSNNLQIGVISNDVTALHKFLTAKGYSFPSINSGASPQDYFGLETQKAVMEYQKSIGVPSTGFVGPMTRGVINGLCNNSSSIPVISRISPVEYSKYGQEITIYGNNLDGATNIQFFRQNGSVAGSLVPNFVSSDKVTFSLSGLFIENSGYDTYLVNVVTNKCKGGCDSNRVTLKYSSFVNNQNVINVTNPSSGVVDSGGQFKVQWTGYSGDFDYYQIMLGNSIANVEVSLDENVKISKYQNSYNSFAVWYFVKQITDRSGLAADKIKDAYYVKVNAVKNDLGGGGIVSTGKGSLFSIGSLTNTPTPSSTSVTSVVPTTPKISINSPKQGEKWNIGDTKTISWNYQNFDSATYGNKYVDVLLVPSDDREPVKLGVNMSAPYNSIPVKIYEKTTSGKSAWLPGTYKVRVACQNTNAASFNSCYAESGYFSVVSPSPSPSPTASTNVI
jgi:hypothetical protein